MLVRRLCSVPGTRTHPLHPLLCPVFSNARQAAGVLTLAGGCWVQVNPLHSQSELDPGCSSSLRLLQCRSVFQTAFMHWWHFLQEEILEETAGLDGPLLTPAPPSAPPSNSKATDPNPWEASWGDLLSSQDSDTELNNDMGQSSSSGASTADGSTSALEAGGSIQAPTDAQSEATGTHLTIFGANWC